MSNQDPIANMLTCVRNGQASGKNMVKMPSSKIKIAIAKVLEEEGCIKSFNIEEGKKPNLEIFLKYFEKKPVIEMIRRISRPSLRIYKRKHDLPEVMAGLGFAIISTSKGIMTDRSARRSGLGGEIICYVA